MKAYSAKAYAAGSTSSPLAGIAIPWRQPAGRDVQIEIREVPLGE